MCIGSHPVSSSITVCALLLCNCLTLWATPTRLSEWPNLQLFGENADSSLTREVRQSTMSDSSSPSAPFTPAGHHTCSGCRKSKTATVNDHGAESASSISAAEKEYRVEVVKQQILNALNMRDPPNIKGIFPSVNPNILEKIFIDSSEEAHVDGAFDDIEEGQTTIHTEKKLIVGVAADVQGFGDSKAKLSFVIPPEIQRAPSTRARLWFNVLNSSSAIHRRLIVTQRFSQRYYVTHVVAFHRITDTKDWVGIDLSSVWSAREGTVHLEVISDSQQPAINISASPILEVNVMTRVKEDDARRRVKRGVHCQSNNPRNCCLQSFSVPRAELRWNWIVYPSSIEVNYCRGSCESGSNHIYNHSSVMYTRSMFESNPNLRAQMMPCCTPKRLGNVQLIYYVEDAALATKVIPNLKVLECGCA